MLQYDIANLNMQDSMNIIKKIFLTIAILGLSGCSEDAAISTNADQTMKDSATTSQAEGASPNEQGQEQGGDPKTETFEHVSPRSKYEVTDNDTMFGNKDAQVTIIEYFSPTCPHCVIYHKKVFPEVKKNYIDTGKVLYVMREFIATKQDLDATILAKCLGDKESYAKFMDVILEQQINWAYSKNYREILTNIGSLGGVSPEKYAACLNDESKIELLIQNTSLIYQDPEFGGTPIFFINRKAVIGLYPVKKFLKEIDEALEAKK
ncbi:MAG: protein-disulfide reductase [Rickettsiales bacterium]|nr:MAG: protein-disulfide reductase [Rickettsiales bacterium]